MIYGLFMSALLKTLLVATGNKGKLTELAELLKGLPVVLKSLADMEDVVEIEETGATFLEIAGLKASGYALQMGLPAIADDSGLAVDALGGRPGILSARYGGSDTDFDEKMAKLLGELDRVGDSERSARFICAMAVADPAGRILYSAEGVCAGN